MHNYYRRLKGLLEEKLGQQLPGWGYVIAIILGLVILIFLIWFAYKSGKATVGPLAEIR